MADRTAFKGGGDIFAPPLEPDLAEHRLSDAFAHPCNLVVEGVKREQRLATRGPGKLHLLLPGGVQAPPPRRDRGKTIRSSGTSLRNRCFSTDLFHRTRDGRHGFRTAAPALPEKRARAAYLRADDGFPSRQASPSLCHEPQHPRQGLPDGEPVARGHHQGHLPGLVKDGRLQQRRASVEPYLLLELYEAERRRLADLTGCAGDL